MNPLQESKQELNAAIRYAENAISSAKQTMESMNTYQEQTGREQALEREVRELKDKVQGQYDDIVLLERANLELVKQKEASSGPCGCQAYRDLEEARGRAEGEVELLQSAIKELEEEARELKDKLRLDKVCAPTMPVIPKAVAIAIFREGVAHGVSNACDEIDNTDSILLEESEYCGDFEVSFSKYIDLSDHLDLDWMRDKVGDYDEASVIEALKNLCADKEFECRIHGVDDQEEKKNED
jgi:polyhydroxyalkanoate synthesis regulator phasin